MGGGKRAVADMVRDGDFLRGALGDCFHLSRSRELGWGLGGMGKRGSAGEDLGCFDS